ncbi:SIR2 family protein, partial [Xanthomonas campestris pv. campestris]|nr:SIR2 family protein [Xanthomonas campestris pv. campestris]MEB1407337.1 SIR2 family protein [Xanthomonas campestris pv. campestris]MEB1428131.1 SIR2 family protein [Xanthomonas campestris pv. campestris]MEB1523061.1 SIR2 family protein [Xanthomonas campestris pv. campestris]MEB1823822.1 SIR2 family protein [Xanthomonas campestris pv. campestris]
GSSGTPLQTSRPCGRWVIGGFSGATNKTRPPTWKFFLEKAIKKIPKRLQPSLKELVQQSNLLLACDVIREEMGRDKFKQLLRESFHDPGFSASEVHKHLLQLDARFTITPNFDAIYDTYVKKETGNTILVKEYYDDDVAEALRSKYPVVVKLHGSITTPDKLIFTASDYAKARSQSSAVYDLVRALLCTHTFLFLGCGLDDPDIRLLLEDYRYKHAIGGSHYFMISKGSLHPDVLKVVGSSLNLNFIQYENSAGDHKNFGVALNDLVTKVNLARN